MGFWQGLGRLVMGKPVFQTDQQSTPPVGQDSPPSNSHKTPVDAAGRKIIPEVEIRNVDSKRSPDSMAVWVSFVNSSDQPVFLDKITLLGQTRELDFELSSGGSRQFEIYRGNLITTNSYRDADLDYRLVSSGDYFRARYYVEPDYDDGFYYPEDFHLQRPVRDV